MIILGLNINHADTSACIIINDKIIAAIEEERFVRIKHYAGLPKNSIEFCLAQSELEIKDIDFITVNYSPAANFKQKTFYSIKNILSKSTFKKILNFKNKLFHTSELDRYLKKNNFSGKIINVEHHMSHIASSYYNSSFKKSVGLTIDGFGDFCSSQTFLCEDNKIDSIKKVYFPHSLGILYQSITQFLGFKNYGDEYKVMGLASYGEPLYMHQFNDLIKYDKKNLFLLNLDYFSHHSNSKFSYNFSNGIPKFQDLYSEKIKNLLGKDRNPSDKIEKRHFDIAASLQLSFENILFLILNDLYNETGVENLCLAGGCALNSKFNGLIKEKTPFKNIFIQPNAGDAGGAMGSALHFIQNKDIDRSKIEQIDTNKCYLGTSYSNEFIEKNLIKSNALLKDYSFKRLEDKDLYSEVADRISKSQIIGWFKGRCEWGPRALGNRSILADPRNPNIKDILNAKIKLRESFRPFAPAVLEEFSDKYFDLDYSSPYMLNVVKAKQLAKDSVPSVVHVDNTCRVQTVSKIDNLHFYNLISEFNKLTNVPIILNTSFNENEPIVLNPDHAFDCFRRTSMDCLVLENWVITR
jgi:carbamoyltransferase|tara:strand:+ start:21561 stop:23303 length:1743 start_codon:yes stop_codon:yes gene_type:complete